MGATISLALAREGARQVLFASVIGETASYASSDAEHQGPPGGGPFAIIDRV